MTLTIPNKLARHLWLDANLLSQAPVGALCLIDVIKALGFVQMDTIQNVTRAHHHILWSRNQNYREHMFDDLLGKDRAVFEHFTHDASVLPMEFLPNWQRQFQKMGEIARNHWYSSTGLTRSEFAAIKERIRQEGPLSTRDFSRKIKGERQTWDRPPHKKALEQMWYAGELATSHRVDFGKFYDLAERVFLAELSSQNHSDDAQASWLCAAAVDRLAVCNCSEIQRFWQAVSPAEAKNWAMDAKLVPVSVEGKDGTWTEAFGAADIEARIERLQTPSQLLRIINPFDPAVRDRKRLLRLFGIDYKNEIFVPAEKRKFGYYVYLLLERDRFVGRIELKADRKKSTLTVVNRWVEPGVNWNSARDEKLDAELGRLGRLIGVKTIIRES
jgi:uncharacterized protein YcaQ